MRKINSIGYAHRILALIAIFLIIIPLFAWLLWRILQHALLHAIAKISLCIGGILAASFVVLLSIEFHQDRKIDKAYPHIRHGRILLKSGFYECQACGSRNSKYAETVCPICGNTFTEGNDLDAAHTAIRFTKGIREPADPTIRKGK